MKKAAHDLFSGPGAYATRQVINLEALLGHQLTGRTAAVAAAAEHKILLVFIQLVERCLQLAGGYVQVVRTRDGAAGKFPGGSYVQQLGLRAAQEFCFKSLPVQVFIVFGSGFKKVEHSFLNLSSLKFNLIIQR